MRTIGVVGGGLMGAGIAFTIARQTSSQVYVSETSAETIEAARGRLADLAGRQIRRGADEAEANEWLSRIEVVPSFEPFAAAELVVEAVYENLELKQDVFARLSKTVAPSAILASNTSGLPITAIASAAQHPERVIGTHFFNPVPVMKLVEIIVGLQTAPETLARAQAFCAELGKETVVSKDVPGFIVTRIGQAMMCEAIRCLEQGVASPVDIDKGMRLGHNYPMGPLELMDLIGLDTELQIQESLWREFGDTFRPSPLLRSLVQAGRLGRKTGQGFHTYPD